MNSNKVLSVDQDKKEKFSSFFYTFYVMEVDPFSKKNFLIIKMVQQSSTTDVL